LSGSRYDAPMTDTTTRDIAFKAELMRAAERIGFTYQDFVVVFFTGAAGEPEMDEIAIHFRGGSVTGHRNAVVALVAQATSQDDLLRICRERELFRERR